MYHPQSNRLGEYGHWNSLDALVKLTAPSGNPGNWPAYLPAVSWAVRNAVHKSTGMRPCRVVFGQKCLLPVDIAMENWPMVDWLGVERAGNKRVELAALRARQLEKRPEDIEKAAEAQRKSRLANRQYFDKHRRHRPVGENHELHGGDLAFSHDTKLDTSHSHKLQTGGLGHIGLPTLQRKEMGRPIDSRN